MGKLLKKIDHKNLIYMCIPVLIILFFPYFILGKNSIFEIFDQLDETLFTYVLNAKYLFSETEIFPEMMGGISKSGVSVSAPFFVPLYKIFSVFHAFCIQYFIVAVSAFVGMYLCAKELTDSSLIAVGVGCLFVVLPFFPVYGLSVMGGPLILYAFLCLYKQKNRILSFGIIVFFSGTSHLVLLGYVVLGFLVLAVIYLLFTKKGNRYFYCGAGLLLITYCILNFKLIIDLFVSSTF